MENYLISYNLNIENKDNSIIPHPKKKKKFIACNYCWKEFYSDDEDNSYYNQNLTNNYDIARKKRKFSKISNSSNQDKTKLKKAYTLHKIEKRYELENKNEDYTPIKYRRISNKKVHFLSKNVVKYIDIESYKKYNSLNTNIDFSIYERNNSFKENSINDKVDAKCTCLLF